MEYGSEMWWVRRPHLRVEKHGEDKTERKAFARDFPCKNKLSTAGNKPVINEKVIFLPTQCLPDIRLLHILLVECDVL